MFASRPACWSSSAWSRADAWGIAVARDGTVYVADTFHNKGCVWRIEPGKAPTIALKRRCFDIALDDRDRLLGLEIPRLGRTGTLWRAGDERPLAEFARPSAADDDRAYVWGEFTPYGPGRLCVRSNHRLWVVQGNRPTLLAGGPWGDVDGAGD